MIGLFIAIVWGAAELKIRNPKSEGRKKSDVRNPNEIPGSKRELPSSAGFRISDFGFLSAFGLRISDLTEAARFRFVVLGIVAAGLSLALILQTSRQLSYWQNTRTLFTHAAQVTRKNAKAVTILGSLLANEGKMDEAMALYAEALRYQPDDPETHFSRANALEKQGKLDEA